MYLLKATYPRIKKRSVVFNMWEYHIMKICQSISISAWIGVNVAMNQKHPNNKATMESHGKGPCLIGTMYM